MNKVCYWWVQISKHHWLQVFLRLWQKEKKQVHKFGGKRKLNRKIEISKLQTSKRAIFMKKQCWLNLHFITYHQKNKTSQFSYYSFRRKEGLAASGPVWSHWQKAEAEWKGWLLLPSSLVLFWQTREKGEKRTYGYVPSFSESVVFLVAISQQRERESETEYTQMGKNYEHPVQGLLSLCHCV